jgi:uncharacterized membrane protein
MTLLALGCVLAAALLHATWNFLAKRVRGGAAFVWLCDFCGVVLLAPLVIAFLFVATPALSLRTLGAVCVSGMLQAAYLICLQHGYLVGDLSVVYPLARGSGSGLAVLGSVLLLGEPLTLLAFAGAACIVRGVVLIAGWRAQPASSRTSSGVLYGLLTGLWIAGYTLWDKTAVTALGLAPLLLYYGSLIVRVSIMAPMALRRWSSVRAHWQTYRRDTIGVALLSATSYLLILSVLRFSAVSAVAPAREISILFGTLMGHRLLTEGHALPRVLGASMLVFGIVVITIGVL